VLRRKYINFYIFKSSIQIIHALKVVQRNDHIVLWIFLYAKGHEVVTFNALPTKSSKIYKNLLDGFFSLFNFSSVRLFPPKAVNKSFKQRWFLSKFRKKKQTATQHIENYVKYVKMEKKMET
jgi:hypothetical protein